MQLPLEKMANTQHKPLFHVTNARGDLTPIGLKTRLLNI